MMRFESSGEKKTILGLVRCFKVETADKFSNGGDVLKVGEVGL